MTSAFGPIYKHSFGSAITDELVGFRPKGTWMGNLYRNTAYFLRHLCTNYGLFDKIAVRIATFGVILNQPTSRGSLKIASKDISVPPIIDPNVFNTKEDRDRLLEATKIVMEFGKTAPFSDLVETQANPPPSVNTDEKLAKFINANLIFGWHPIGTCKMSNRGDGVVNSQLQVKGVENLRVIDASIMPKVVSGNTHVAT